MPSDIEIEATLNRLFDRVVRLKMDELVLQIGKRPSAWFGSSVGESIVTKNALEAINCYVQLKRNGTFLLESAGHRWEVMEQCNDKLVFHGKRLATKENSKRSAGPRSRLFRRYAVPAQLVAGFVVVVLLSCLLGWGGGPDNVSELVEYSSPWFVSLLSIYVLLSLVWLFLKASKPEPKDEADKMASYLADYRADRERKNAHDDWWASLPDGWKAMYLAPKYVLWSVVCFGFFIGAVDLFQNFKFEEKGNSKASLVGANDHIVEPDKSVPDKPKGDPGEPAVTVAATGVSEAGKSPSEDDRVVESFKRSAQVYMGKVKQVFRQTEVVVSVGDELARSKNALQQGRRDMADILGKKPPNLSSEVFFRVSGYVDVSDRYTIDVKKNDSLIAPYRGVIETTQKFVAERVLECEPPYMAGAVLPQYQRSSTWEPLVIECSYQDGEWRLGVNLEQKLQAQGVR